MRRIGICCALSLLAITSVGRAAPLGPSNSASSAGSSMRAASLQSSLTARRQTRGGDVVLFGDKTIQHMVGLISPGRAEAFPFAVHRAGTVSAIRVYVDAHNIAKTLIVALYSDRSGHPARRVASGRLSSPKVGSWNKVGVTRAKVRSRSTYWIAVLGQGGRLSFRDRKNDSCQARMSRKSHLALLPRLWASETRLNACPISAYATGHATKTGGSSTTTFGTLGPPNPTLPVNTSVTAPQVGAPTPAGVTCSQTLNAGTNVQSVVAAASPGQTVCLNPGSWSAISLSNVNPASPGVTLAASPGQTVVVPGIKFAGSVSNLTVEGFNITVPATSLTDGGYESDGIRLVCGSAGGLVIEHNTISDQPGGAGFYIDPTECGGATQTGVTIQYNQISQVSTGAEIQSYGAENNLSFSHNVMEAVQDGGYGHYIEVNGGINGYTEDNNAFLGPPVSNNCNPNGSAAHLNVLHIDSGDILNGNAPETNISFNNNIIWHDQACGQAALITDGPLSNVQTNNNLFVADPGCATLLPYACDASSLFVDASNGLTANHNTSVNELRGFVFGPTTQYTISSPNNMTAQYNIAAPAPERGDSNYDTWKCSSACNSGNNVSYDSSANTVFGGTGNVVNWKSAWQNTTWSPNTSGSAPWNPPPQGYYQPSTGGGVTPAYGYQGSICTASIRTNCIGP